LFAFDVGRSDTNVIAESGEIINTCYDDNSVNEGDIMSI
jgi:hypothetical protein